MVPAQVQGDGPQPGEGPQFIESPPVELAQRPVGAYECLLGEIFRFLVVAAHATQTPIQPGPDILNQGREGAVEVRGQRPGHFIHPEYNNTWHDRALETA